MMLAMEAAHRVLVVEDDPLAREAITNGLEAAGYEVRAKADGLSAERAAATFAADVALVDMRLSPGHDGVVVARRLSESHGMPIIFLTASGNIEDRLAGFEAGARHHLLCHGRADERAR